MDYKFKYLKYKKKYIELQYRLYGMNSYTETEYIGNFRRLKGGSSTIQQIDEAKMNNQKVMISDHPKGLNTEDKNNIISKYYFNVIGLRKSGNLL